MEDAFSSSPLQESFPSGIFRSPIHSPGVSPTRTELDFPIDVDRSFNSSMTLTDDSPPPTPSSTFNKQQIRQDLTLSLTPSSRPPRPPRRCLDPAPFSSRSSLNSGLENDARSVVGRKPLAASPLATGRLFGRDLSLNARFAMAQASAKPGSTKSNGMMPPPATSSADMSPQSHPCGGPLIQWTSSNDEATTPRLFAPSNRRDSEPIVSPRPVSEETMDVDSPQQTGFGRSPTVFGGHSSSGGSPGLGSYFCDSPSAPVLPPAKRRSLINSSPSSPSSSPSAKRTSIFRPSEKIASSSALLFGAPRNNAMSSRRSAPYKRPSLLPVVPSDGTRTVSTSSAYPILYGPPKATLGQSGIVSRNKIAPMRRAFSVCDQAHLPEMSEEESEHDISPSGNQTHAEYARRHGITRIDGSPGFKPSRSSIAVSGEGEGRKSPSRCAKASPYGPGGLPGFGDNEVDGKILPCHKVKEDGLVRITAHTLGELLTGKYADRLKRFHILDCRFDYEFDGGHIAGAINVKSMDQLDELLLHESSGVNANGVSLPVPSRSGELDVTEQVVLIFHCEFSAKRAPTFAKHLRSRDRMLNNSIYPKIYYPEVYILEGGYCNFFQFNPTKCEPQAYVAMDDPRHCQRRNSDLHDFRKFTRTRSFTYGEGQMGSIQHSRVIPPCPPLAFAAASAAIGRRHGNTITEEEHEHDSSPLGDACSSIGNQEDSSGSPCPPALSLGQSAIFGSAKTRTLGRAGFSRVASYAGSSGLPR